MVDIKEFIEKTTSKPDIISYLNSVLCWRTIDTAKKDGSEIIVKRIDNDDTFIVRWQYDEVHGETWITNCGHIIDDAAYWKPNI